MAYNNDQEEFPLPGPNSGKRTSAQHLPRYFRTETNKKFLSSTLDQLLQPGVAEKINGYFGRTYAKAFDENDNYISETLKQRSDYQFEPAAVIKDDLDNVQFYADYNDYINQIRNLGGSVDNHSLLNRQEYYAWNPHIDWDKFVNFREYYWLPNGPQPVPVAGESIEVETTYTVTNVDNLDNRGFVFTPDGFTQNPELTLYRGITYRFDINSPNLPISFRTNRTVAPEWNANVFYRLGEIVLYEGQIFSATQQHRASDDFEADGEFWSLNTEFNLTNEVSQQNVDQGTIEVTLNQQTPDFIYYLSDLDANAGGLIRVYDIEEAAFVDVEREILGKKSYTSGNGVSLSNGQKIYFQGTTFPESYQTGNYYVDGVGDRIKLISEEDLTLSSAFVEDEQISFDEEGFDTIPFSTAIGFPREKDYITINRSSLNGNLWSKYNRWFHREIIESAAEINGTELDLDQAARATRPIIEFEPGLKLINFGTEAKQSVDLVDDFTKDVFSTIEGSEGYNVDGVDLTQGQRILFIADPDIRVNGKIYSVDFITFKGKRQIALRETEDSKPELNQTVLCRQGTANNGEIFYFNGDEWLKGQNKRSINQEPLFELFNCNGDSLADTAVYESTTFQGTPIFSYKRNNNSPTDPELGFGISYKNIENVGDIEFEFNLLSDGITYCPQGENTVNEKTGIGYLRIYNDRENFKAENGWKKAPFLSKQPVIRQYVAETNDTDFPIDVFDNSASIEDLEVKIYLNNHFQIRDIDYSIVNIRNTAVVRFPQALLGGDSVLIKALSSQTKNQNGLYEIPINLERNPENTDLETLTLGEVNNHVGSIVESLDAFVGEYPGPSNLRDNADITKYGTRIVKHSVPANLSLYHLVSKQANVVKAIEHASREYGRFKRRFLQIAQDLPFVGDAKEHVDKILNEQFKDKTDSDPYFFADMLPLGGAKINRFTVSSSQQQFFALSTEFTLTEMSNRAVLVYVNDAQLIVGKDYEFNSEGFIRIKSNLVIGDEIAIYEYENTNGAGVPPTPSKLGLFPRYEPKKYLDDTYIDSKEVIQGHDGSITIAYGDFRDDLILELEKRIYNNVKIDYNPKIFDIYDFLPSQNRNTGLSLDVIDGSMLPDFLRYLGLVDEDYTENSNFLRTDTFTYNYAGSRNFNEDTVKGWWRGIYQNAYDTDAPHTRPWEMLGFVDKPDWWEEQYGPAPYTSNNLLLWEDLEKGIIREKGELYRIDTRFARPALTSHLPVDEQGKLLSPLESGYIKSLNFQRSNEKFEFGDWSPVETAWRRNSEYRFSLIKSLVLNQPNRLFAVAFDRARQYRGPVNNIVYGDPNVQIELSKTVFPDEENGIYTSGLVNWVKEYVKNVEQYDYESYISDVRNIQNQIGFKVGGFTSKEKFNLLLDSRTPSNQGNVFVPPENYEIFVNKTAPIRNLYYSGVIVEKRTNGFLIRGYNSDQPFFYYDRVLPSESDSLVNVGGIPEPTVEWAPDKQLVKGLIVVRIGKVYRVAETHVTKNSFEEDKFVQIPSVPSKGGREAFIRTNFETGDFVLPYNTILETIQDVVDFILGYNNWLQRQGFVFDYYDREEGLVADWQSAAKEFLFWTTQNWAEGSVLALSPAAYSFKFQTEVETVDDIYDTFYGYSLLKVDGKKLQPEYVSITREDTDEFRVRTKNTADGIYGIRISTVQKEHAVILDDTTVFNDVIFDKQPGFRQERIQVLGYRSANWNGSFNVDGFIYDNATLESWQPWRDYAIGDLVQYKEFYYSARNKVPGSATFNSRDWYRLDEKPQSQLLPNWDYKANQFADFYDLDTDNFDEDQQKFAQHLIGYQNRRYLENIINDDVSQYKFYQGYIQDKGTRNSLEKLFDVLSNTDKDSLEFYEEWAVKSGQYGATKGFEEVEFLLDENKFKTKPQPFELVDVKPAASTDLVYRIEPNEVYQKPENYDHEPFPQKAVLETFTKNAGYVNPDDIDWEAASYEDILGLDITKIRNQDKIWVGNIERDWSVLTVLPYRQSVKNITADNGINIEFNESVSGLDVGAIIGIKGLGELSGFYSITQIDKTTITLGLVTSTELPDDISSLQISILENSRFKSVFDANNAIERIEQGLDRIWIDELEKDRWQVLDKKDPFKIDQTISERTDISDSFGYSVSANKRNTVVVIGAPTRGNGEVYIYTRPSESSALKLVQTIEADTDLAFSYPVFDEDSTAYFTGDIVKRFNKHYKAKTDIPQNTEFNEILWEEIESPDKIQRFGHTVAVNDSGEFIAIGSPTASNVKTFYKGKYREDQDYSAGSIVLYQDQLWAALENIAGAEDSIQFGSFESVPQILQDLNLTNKNSESIRVLLAGNYPYENISTDHFIIKAPRDMFEGSAAGDTLTLKWNNRSFAYQSQTAIADREPFSGKIPFITSEFLSGKFEISAKFDSILYVDSATAVPNINQTVEAIGVSANVLYTYRDETRGSVTIYVQNQNGNFGLSGSLFTEAGEFVGEYETQAPTSQTANVDDYWGGYWKIDLSQSYAVGSVNADEARGLVFADLKTDSFSHGFYYNILDYSSDAFSSFDTRNSELSVLSYRGLPGPQGVIAPFLSDLFVLRGPDDLTGIVGTEESLAQLQPGDTIEVFYNAMPRFADGSFKNPEEIGLSIEDINREHVVEDVWDGYIDVLLTVASPFSDRFIEPRGPEEGKQTLTVRPVNFAGNGEAEIAYYQKFDTDSVRLYLKNVRGDWPAGTEFGVPREVEFVGVPQDADPLYQVTRSFGQIQSKSLGYEEDGIGRMLVLRANNNIEIANQSRILDAEYWFYREEPVQGIPRQPNLPAVDNNDWQITNRILVDSQGSDPDGDLNQEGMFSVYRRTGASDWSKVGSFIVPDRKAEARLGTDLNFAQINSLTRLFVTAQGNGTVANKGKIYTIKNGVEGVSQYNWGLGADKRYKGEFSESRNYFEDDVVFFDRQLYQAVTNVVQGEFDPVDWKIITGDFDYLGFIPNNTGLNLDDSATLDQINLEQFSQDFDSSDNGEVISVSSKFTEESENSVVIYRNNRGFYEKSQIITAPSTKSHFGKSIAISNDGKNLAIAVPYDDGNYLDSGSVLIYREIDREFKLTETLVSPTAERGEVFGLKVDWDNDTLAIAAKNASSRIETTFDNGNTVFDSGFTEFVDISDNTGVIMLFQDYGDALLYGQTIDYDKSDVRFFGRNFISSNNQLYVALPKFTDNNTTGQLLNYRRNFETGLWTTLRKVKPTVDVSKIKQVMLYDVKRNRLIERLDFVDPLQGKIPGIAEQEISYKTYFDPAVYTNGNGVRINETRSWDENQVGEIWWDLTDAKFRNPYQGTAIFSANNWNTLFSSEYNAINVYEWVESAVLPSRWDELSETEEGFTRGITGFSKYGNSGYVQKQFYNTSTKTFSTRYYFWVGDKTTKPNLARRRLSAKDIKDLIQNPQAEGYRYVQFISPREFALVNCDDLITGTEIALSIQYYTIEDQTINAHNEYQIITEGLSSSKPSNKVETKWLDSLVGVDVLRRPVPDPELSEKEKYGVLDSPRQGWFVNRIEALKQVVERINSVLKQNLIVDEKDISRLTESEPQPPVQSGLFDTTVETVLDLDFIGVARAAPAQLTPVIENGRIVEVIIDNPGRGYQIAPRLDVQGSGKNAELISNIDSAGRIASVEIKNQGEYYDDRTGIAIRQFSALVLNDDEINGRWAIWERDVDTRQWTRIRAQGYNVNLYWDYQDWYAEGYNSSSEIDYVVNSSYKISSLNDEIGDIVKIENVGTGGWLLLEKIDNQPNVDYTVNYNTVGRENGTIQVSPLLYNIADNLVAYDTGGYDNKFYDSIPTVETRIILETVRDNIFVDDLALEYNRLFFASLRYVLSEQNYIDWAFKTSFVKAQHNVGELEQKITFRNDNLPNYEDYVKEVKPYRSSIREYLSSYEKIDRTSSVVTDFDLAPRFVNTENKILPYRTQLSGNSVNLLDTENLDYPEKYWLDSIGFEVQSVVIADPGKGYTSAPVIEIVGGGGTDARAIASIGRDGILTSITIIDTGSGYIVPPTIRINGSIQDGGQEGRAVAVLGGSPVRSITTGIKFDRVSGDFEFTELITEEKFIGTGAKRNFNLQWPMDLRTNLVSVLVNGTEALGGQYTYKNIRDFSKGYERYLGVIEFDQPPVINSEVIVRYYKSINLLNAQDRINLSYNPGEGDLGKSLGQLMEGIDYGGVEVRSYGFASTTGWDAQPWFSQSWDVFDTDYEDYIIDNKLVTLEFENPITLDIDSQINQDNTGASGRVVNIIDDKTVEVSSTVTTEFNTKDQLRLDDSSLIGEDSTQHVPDKVSNQRLILDKPLENGEPYNVYKISRTSQGTLIANSRLDDPDFGSSGITNPDAICETIIGDGSNEIPTTRINLSQLTIEQNADLVSIIIRKETSDGSFIPDPESYDTSITGGNLNYQTAKGIKAEDINIDGDGFVTPTTSKGPEEIVPGQVLDVVDIQVYERPSTGSSSIESRNYIGDGSTFIYDIGSSPVKLENLFVKIDNRIIDNYVVDYNQNTVILNDMPAQGERVNILNLGNAGLSIIDIMNFTGDGKTREFLLNVTYSQDVESFVTVNGEEYTVELFEAADSTDTAGNIVARFDEAPSIGAFINVLLTEQSDEFRNYSQVSIDKFTADGSTTQFALANNIFASQPALANVIVKVNDKILNAGFTEVFQVDTARQYQLNLTQLPAGSASSKEIEVYLNERPLNYIQEWRFTGSAPTTQLEDTQFLIRISFESSVNLLTGAEIFQDITDARGTIEEIIDNNTVIVSTDFPPLFDKENEIRLEDSTFLTDGSGNTVVPSSIFDSPSPATSLTGSIIELERGIGKPGDELKVYVIGDAEYRFGFFNSEGDFVPQRGEDSSLPVLNLDDSYMDGDEITVYTFSNHDGQGIERQSFDVTEKTETTPGTERYFNYRQLTRGLLELRKPAIDAEYVWVMQNGKLLIPSVDYKVTADNNFIELAATPQANDELEVFHFANPPITQTFGWRQFKDMLNRTHYKRLVTPVRLAKELNWYDKTIEIDDASSLPEPDFNSPNPGVIFVDGERIEYFIKDGNTLKQIRRGTLGTGVKNQYSVDTPVMDQSSSETMPYRDEEQVVTITAGGYSDGLSQFENSFGVSIDSVSYDFNNNTAYPLGGQIATVKGTGFTQNAQIFVGETECEVTEVIDEETLTFITPALPVGSYDLIVVNPEIFDSTQEQPRTTAVKPGAINYVQVLLPYSPSPETDIVDNPAAKGDWYRAPFDEGGIPEDYWQALDIEVFVGGKRLSKSPRQVYNYEAQDSPEGDIEVQAEFAVNKDIGAYVRLSEPPQQGVEVSIIRKTLTDWTEPNTRLSRSNTEVAKFLRAGSTDLPR